MGGYAPGDAATLVELLRRRAERTPDRTAYTFLVDGGEAEARLTYAELDRRARAVAALLQRHAAPGERAILLYPPGLDYITGFFGCLYAGVVAVPVYPPRQNRSLERLEAILADARPALALTTPELLEASGEMARRTPSLDAVRWLATADVADAMADAWTPGPRGGAALAFLQYTSGSTARPRGVMLTHANLLHNLGLIHRFFGHSEESRVVVWLPPYHDMGLIGGILQPFYGGYPATLMSPFAFLQRPLRWLEAVSRHRGTTSGGPNFAYDLCVQKTTPEERAGLDLSCWEIAFNGAEPVRAESMDAFARAFAGCGFRREAFYPCYGLAEATLMVTGSRPGAGYRELRVDAAALAAHRVAEAAGDPGARRLVASGANDPGQRLRIVDPATGVEAPPDRVGEVWVGGPSVARGYWGLPEKTAEVFGARTAGGEGPFLRTGDLGFVRGGELYVTGRIKDLVIVRGRNHYPHDLEATAGASHAALQPGRGAAFSVEAGGEERLVIVHEVRRQALRAALDEVPAAVRSRVALEHGVQVYTVALLPPGSIPKTSSGKTQRLACRAGWLAGELPVILADTLEAPPGGAAPRAAAPPAGLDRERLEAADAGERQARVEAWMETLLARAAGVRAGPGDRRVALAALGVDSLGAAAVASALEAELGVKIAVTRVLEAAGVEPLAAEVVAALLAPPPAADRPDDGDEGRADGVPSFAQERLWLLDRLRPGDPSYNLAGAVELRGRLDVPSLRRALDEVARRHDALRLCFSAPGGTLGVRAAGARPVPFAVVELSALDPAARRGAAHALAAATGREPFDLAGGRLLRARLLRLGPARHRLVLATHHAACDGWSAGVLLRELTVLYAAFSAGAPSPLPAAPGTLAAAARQRAALTPGRETPQLEFWRARLDGAEPLAPPADFAPAPAPAAAPRGALRRFGVAPALAGRLRALGRAEGATLFTVVLTALQALLARHAGRDDVVVGTPVHGRDAPGLADALGCWINPVVLRTDLSGGPTVREALGRAREGVRGALEHAGVPFERLVEALRPEAGAGHPWFQVLFAFHAATLAPTALPGLSLEPRLVDNGTAKYPLSLHAGERPDGGLWAALEYDAGRFDAATAARLAAGLKRLLAGMAADPGAELASLALMGAAQRARVLEAWNRTARPRPRDACVHHLFEAWAARTPGAPAVVWNGRALSYAEVNARANRLAHALRRRGVGPEVAVGVCVERGADLPVAVLAVLKAGGAYVPLDPGYPRERLEHVLADSGARVLVADSDPPLAVPAGVRTVRLDRDAAEVAAESAADPAPGAGPANLAYLIYTSGSTGRPKGVMNPHGAVVNLLAAFAGLLPLGAGDAWVAVTPLSFDIAALELFLPLAVGARVVVAPRAAVEDGRRLAALLDASEATALQATPSGWQLLVDAGWEGRPGLKALCGGEALAPALAVELARRCGRAWNVYGPTETTIWSTAARLDGAAARGRGVSIGRPLANQRAYVLDAALRPVPPGVPGRLYLGGAGVARGYWRRPALSAERFVPDPYGGEPGGRLYDTGDRARWSRGGTLEFLGRADDQVKLRGHRIEPGEVEAALRGHPGVRHAAVAARDDGAGLRLVAYVVPRGRGAAPAELRRWLRERLPGPMVPAAFVELDQLPRTPNGKLDRRALPAPARADAGGEALPRTPCEEVVAAIWAELLDVDRVGRGADFFALGGHSLLAGKVAARVREALGAEVPLRALFDHPTLEGYARAVGRAGAGEGEGGAPLGPAPRGGALPLSSSQERLWFLDRLRPGNAAYNLAGAVRLGGELNRGALRRSLDALVARHEALRTSFAAAGGRPVQRVHPPRPLALPVLDLSALGPAAASAEAERTGAAEASRPFALDRAPLVRARLLRLSRREHVLLLTLHHVVCDGWSLGVLARELGELYVAFAAGRPSPLAPLPLQYADYAVWQRARLASGGLAGELAHWTGRLRAATGDRGMAPERPRPAVPTFRGAQHASVLAADTADLLRTLARSERATPFMALLAVFKAVLHARGGTTPVVVGTDVASRGDERLAGVVGHFVNQLVLSTDLSGEPTFRQLLRRVRESTLDAYAHQELPFNTLVEALNPVRDPGRNPLFQTMLVLDAAPVPLPALPTLTMELLPAPLTAAPFDLSLLVAEEGGGFRCLWRYATDLFQAPTIAALAEQFEATAATAAAAPDEPLGALAARLAAVQAERRRHELERLRGLRLQKLGALRSGRAEAPAAKP